MKDVGLVLGSTVDPAEIASAAAAVESAGFGSIWTTEDFFMTGGVAATGIALAATKEVTVGLGLLSIYTRHPALMAMEAATLSGAYPGRFILGLGTGVFRWLDQMGLPHEAPLVTMREAVESLRALLAGETLTGSGRYTFGDVRLDFPPAQPPQMWIGAIRPKLTGLAGEIADGMILSVNSGREFAARARAAVDASTPAGAPRRTITAFSIFSHADDVAEAYAAARPVIAGYLATGGQNPLTDAAGISAELVAILRRGGRDALEAEMPDEWIEMLSVSGDAAACAAAIDGLLDAGVDSVVLLPVSSENLAQRISSAGASILPLLRPR